MLEKFNSKILIFSLTVILGIMIPQTTRGISFLHLDKYQNSSDLVTNFSIDIPNHPTTIDDRSCQWSNNKEIYLVQGVICQRLLVPNILLRRIANPDGSCLDQTIDTGTGNILQQVPAPCDPNC